MTAQAVRISQRPRRKPLSIKIDPKERVERIIEEWKSGEFTQTQLCNKHSVSIGYVNKLVKGVEKDSAVLIKQIMQTKQSLANMTEIGREVVAKVVDEKVAALAFYNATQNKLATIAMQSLDAKLQESGLAGISTNDIDGVSRVVDRSRNGVVGKAAETNIQINTGSEAPAAINFFGKG